LRIFGEAKRVIGLPKLDDATLNAIANYMMTEEDSENYKQNLSADLGMSIHGRRYRINISRQRDHIMIVARLLEEKVPTIDEKNLPQIFKQLVNKTNGIIFVA
jgi:twitching motility protein PilT